MPKLTVRDLAWRGKRVLVRVDFNVPLSKSLEITDDTRIRETVPTLRLLLDGGARLVLASHLGRPDGKVNEAMRLAPAARRLQELLKQPVLSVPDCIGPESQKASAGLTDGQVMLLENVRFQPGEEKNDPAFAQALASLADSYVNDAFGTAHRAHASTVGVTKLLSPCAAGLLMEKELTHLGAMLASPARPFVAILGGKKVSDKIEVIESLLPRVDRLLIGGGMMFTFWKAAGRNVGGSVLEAEKVGLAKELLARAGDKIVLPVDALAAQKVDPASPTREVAASEGIPDGWIGVDVGTKTSIAFSAEIGKAKTILWNGPMGIFEMAPFALGTFGVAQAVAASGATSVVGGGDSVAAVHKAGVADKITHISTGGGASLEFLEGKTLPGVAALTDA